MRYKQLTQDQRYQISSLLKACIWGQSKNLEGSVFLISSHQWTSRRVSFYSDPKYTVDVSFYSDPK